MRSAKRWWMVRKLDGNENERRSSVRLQWAGKYWKVRWLESPRYLIYHEAVEIESQTKSFFILFSYFSNKVEECCLPLGLGRIRLTSRAYDYMNMMWILRRSIIKISFIFRIYDVNMLLHIFICSYSNIAMMICKKALRLMLVFMLVYWMRSKLNLVCCGPTYPIKSQGTREKNLWGPGVWNTLQFDSILSMSGDQIFGPMWPNVVQIGPKISR